jgi:pimeloyl-ACP methyl ester carboxylesterase
MVAEWGDPDGVPVLLLHGTPGCRFDRHPNQELVRSLGVRLVTYDRPGYGGSDRHRGRRIVECTPDVVAVADALTLERFAVWGMAGGGPHALAVAARLAERVTRVLCVRCVAPYDALGDDWFSGMDPQNVQELHWAIQGEDQLAERLRQEDHSMRQAVLTDPARVLESFDLPEGDRRLLARPDFAEITRLSTFEQTRNGVWGWVDDDLAFVLPWGFDPASIVLPVRLEFGQADVLVPPSHGAWLAARMPAAEVVVHPASSMDDPDGDLLARLGWLTRGTTAAAAGRIHHA